MCQGGNFPCYAYRLANGRLRNRYLANKNTATKNYDEDSYPFYPRFWPEKVKDMDMFGKKKTYAINIRKPKGIFVCDMGELFGDWVPEYWQKSIFLAIKSNPWHRFYLLTKQPQNLVKFSPFPDNCWVGVTATNWLMFSDALGHLTTIEAKVKYLSFEPLLSEIKLDMMQKMLLPRVINWLVIGAQTKPYKPPKIEWVEEIVEAAGKASVPVFLKDNLNFIIPEQDPLFRKAPHILRQEMPE